MGNTCSNGGVSIVMLVFGGVIFQGVFYDSAGFLASSLNFPDSGGREIWHLQNPNCGLLSFCSPKNFPKKKIGTQIYFAWSFFHVTKNTWHFPWPLIYDFLFRFTRFIFPKNEHPIRHWVSHGCLGIPGSPNVRQKACKDVRDKIYHSTNGKLVGLGPGGLDS